MDLGFQFDLVGLWYEICLKSLAGYIAHLLCKQKDLSSIFQSHVKKNRHSNMSL